VALSRAGTTTNHCFQSIMGTSFAQGRPVAGNVLSG
jgi:hypothetical protein